MVNDIPAVAVDNTDEEQERAHDVHVLDIDMPLLMWSRWLHKRPFRALLLFSIPATEQTGLFQYPISR